MAKNNLMIHFFNYLLIAVFSILFVSCVDSTEMERLATLNGRLTNRADSLQELLNNYEVLTVLNNNNFDVAVGEKYTVETMAVIKGGLKMDSLIVNGRFIKEGDSVIHVDQGFLGPVITFNVDSSGVYDITAFVSSFAWKNNHQVKTEWTLYAKEH